MDIEEPQDFEGEGAKWLTHYCNDHQILLVGEENVTKKYKNAKSNLDELQKLGAYLLHGVDATKMKFHSDLKMRRFDRIIFNFPHAGFHRKEDNLLMIKMHKDLVFGFSMNASCMLRANGEIHVNHKTTPPFNNWNIEKLAMQSFLTLIECAIFKKEDYPGYNNKRGDRFRCDEPFPLGKCSTFKFVYNPRARRNLKRRNHMVFSTQQTNLPSQEIQDVVVQLPTSADPNYYPQTSYIPKMNEAVTSIFSLTNGYTPISRNYLKSAVEQLPTPVDVNYYPQRGHIPKMNEAVREVHGYVREAYGGTAASGDYDAHHNISLGSRRSLLPMESLQSLQPWPTSTNVRYSLTDHVRAMDIPLSHGARYEGYCGSSNYLQGATCRAAQRASYCYEFDIVRPDFEMCIDEEPRRTLTGDIYVQNELHRRGYFMSERRMFVGS
ncbi:hypothetical protein SESBI_35356 [Sesbania bispinosa]|nr:hypothetical protein SESBI_35356 [Sesbania bispinosa]